MKIEELTGRLTQAGFQREALDSGCFFTRKEGHFSLICYIEPEMDIQFIATYHWNNNDVKGTYNISLKAFSRSNDDPATFFARTKENLPQRIGDRIDTHEELDKVLKNFNSLA